MRRLPLILAAGLVSLAVALGACGDDEASSTDSSTTPADVTGTDATGDTTGQTTDNGGPEPSLWAVAGESNDWRAVFGYAGRIAGAAGNSQENELWVMDPDGSNKEKLTELADFENFDPPLSCEWGCFPDSELKWMAIGAGERTAQGFDFRIGSFNNSGTFKLIKDLVLADKIDFKFAGDRLYYSEVREGFEGCLQCQYDIFFIDLTTQMKTKILTFPPDDDLEQTTYRGHFKVSNDGRKLVLLNTTIRSVGVYLWINGAGLSKIDFLCELGTEDNCLGSGSEYSDKDPVAISNDGKTVVFFTFSDRFQRARVYNAEDPKDPPRLAVLGSVPQGSWIQKSCEPGQRPDWQWQRVIGDPVFTPDDSEIVFLVEDACRDQVTNQPPTKAQRNLKRVKLETLRSGKTLASKDVFSVTTSPKGDVTDNIYITGFDLSPDGATALFVGSPQVNQSGETLDDGNKRQRSDREVWRVRLDGENRTALTNDVAWEARSPLAIPNK